MGADEPEESLSQRELRNESGRVLRAVAEGQSFVLTNRGHPVGKIVAIDAAPPALPIVRPAKRKGGWATLGIRRAAVSTPAAQILDELREDRA